jgi:hypothetical protein
MEFGLAKKWEERERRLKGKFFGVLECASWLPWRRMPGERLSKGWLVKFSELWRLWLLSPVA